MSTDFKIKSKIAALFAKAEGTDNPHEAAAFMAKAVELLEQNQLERWEVDSVHDPLGATLGTIVLPGGGHWKRLLAGQIARFFYAKLVLKAATNRSSARVYEIVGRESCRITVELMLPYIFSCVKKEAQKLLETTEDKTLNRDRAERAVGNALSLRVAEMVHAREENGKVTKSLGAGLVLVNELDAYIDANYRLRAPKKISLVTNERAKNLANKISLNKQTAHSGQKQIA